MKPVTPLPWVKMSLGSHKFALHSQTSATYAAHMLKTGDKQNVDYIVHAANAYPQLVAELQDAIRWCPAVHQDKIIALLKQLGEPQRVEA